MNERVMKLKARNRVKLETILGTLIVIVALIYAIFIRPNYYNFNGGKIFFEPIFSESLQNEESSKFYTYEGAIFHASENGLKKTAADGVSIWDKTFYVLTPMLYTNNQYMAVVDIAGKEAHLFDENGSLADIKTEYPILFACVSSEGALALVEEKEGLHLIQLYNRKGILVAERLTVYKDDGYPIGISLSSTGEKMVTSYLTMDLGKIQTSITFFSFGEAGENDPEKILGGFIIEDTLAPEVHFMDDEHVVVVGDQNISFYNIEGKPKLETQIQMQNEIVFVSYNQEQIILSLGNPIGGQEEDLQGYIMTFNNEGKREEKFKVSEKISNLIAEKKGFYIVTENSIRYHLTQKKLWENDNYKEAIDIQKIDQGSYLIVYGSGYEIVKIKDI